MKENLWKICEMTEYYRKILEKYYKFVTKKEKFYEILKNLGRI